VIFLLAALWVLVLLGLVHLAVDADLTKPIRVRLSGLPSRVASCPVCSAGWLSTPAAGAVMLLALIPWPWNVVYGFAVVAPPAGIGLVVLLTLISPANAASVAFKEMDKRRSE